MRQAPEVRLSLKIRHLLCAVLACLSSAGNEALPAQPSPVSSAGVAYVGHSLINYDMPYMVKDIAASLSVSYRHAVQVIIGSSIEYNWDHCHEDLTMTWPPWWFACDAIENGTAEGPMDTLIVTQANGFWQPNNPTNLAPTPEHFNRFLRLFKQNHPAGRAFYYTPWEPLDASGLASRDWTAWVPEQLSFWESVVQESERLYQQQYGQAVDVQIIPSAFAVRELILQVEAGGVPSLSNRYQIFDDTVHLNSVGNYFVACVVYASVYERTPVGATGHTTFSWGGTSNNLDPALALKLQQIAWQVVSTYRGWPSGSAVKPRAPTGFQVN